MRRILLRVLAAIPAVALQVVWLLALVKWLAPWTACCASSARCAELLSPASAGDFFVRIRVIFSFRFYDK